jgi:hypothetical protein
MDGNGTIARVYTALFVFCGVGGGVWVREREALSAEGAVMQ